MGLAAGGGGGGGGSNGGGNGSCCDMSLKCWCRWRLENRHYLNRLFSSGFVFFFGCLILFGSIATLYAWLAFTPAVRTPLSPFGCLEDNEGSWSIGVFFGDSPFSLKPIETVSFSASVPFSLPLLGFSNSNFFGKKFLCRLIFFLYLKRAESTSFLIIYEL